MRREEGVFSDILMYLVLILGVGSAIFKTERAM